MMAAFGAVFATGSAAAEPSLPPIVDPASQVHHTGKVVFVQLVTPDLAAAKLFYAGLFGWDFRDVAGLQAPYTIAFFGGQMVGGVVQRVPPPGSLVQPAWLSFFAVPDVDAAVAGAAAQGAKVLRAPRSISGLGREAVLSDPQGAVFGVLASSSGDPPDMLRPAGDWIWRSLTATDPAGDAAFYHTLFGFQVFTLPSAPGEQHLLLGSEDYARASVNAPPAARPNAHPHWLNFVRVVDAGQAAAKAQALGGRVLVAPHPDRHGGMIAVVADPQGAPVGLMEWADGESKELRK